MKAWLGYSLRRKLSLLMLVFALIPMLFLGLFAYGISAHLTKKNALQLGTDTLRQIRGNLSSMIEDVEGMSIYLIGQRDIQRYLHMQEDHEQLRADIVGDIANLARSKYYISHISIYASQPGTILSSSSIYDNDFHTPIDVTQFADKSWNGLTTIRDFAGERDVITFVRPLRSIYDYQVLGWLTISLDERQVSRDWVNVRLGGVEGQVSLIDSQGQILSSTDQSLLFDEWDQVYPGTREAFARSAYGEVSYRPAAGDQDDTSLIYYQEPLNRWTLVSSLPTSWYGAQSNYILHLTVAAVVLALLLSGGLTLFVLRRVTKPLQLLTRLLTKVDPHHPLPAFHTDTQDEIARLGESYNLLGEHIEELKRQVIQNENRKKQADMQALQAQINPHFLYNTLSSIHWMALMNGNGSIAEMVGSLSDFLRFSLNQGKDYCPLRQELAHIRNYERVQSIRYPDKFKLDMNVEESLMEMPVLKLLLQPLVENAMVHGIQKKQGLGSITVIVEGQGARMMFHVLDDGVGMEPERLAELRNSLENGAERVGYGVFNVHERLLLHYGGPSGLQIDSKPGVGTHIRFSIPVRGEDEHEDINRG